MKVVTWDCKNHVVMLACIKPKENLTVKPTFLMSLANFGLSKSGAEKRKTMWKKSGLGVRCIKKANGKYVVYWEYPGVIPEEDGSSLFHVG
jgi:hypothetical protein